MPADPCVYTSLIGRYEALNEQPMAASSRFRFICLTDDPELASATWECRLVRPVFALDPIRSQRAFKMLPHVHLPEFGASLYIDNSIVLTSPPEEIWKLLPQGAGLAMPRHSFRATVFDEFMEVVQLGLDDPGRIFEQLNHYALTCPEVLEQPPWWSAILLREHGDQRVRQAMEFWFAHTLRYARRDQLSINLALHEAALRPVELLIDNHESWFHRWPVAHGRDRDRGPRNPLANLTPLAARVRVLQRRLEEAPAHSAAAVEAMRARIGMLETEVAQLRGSASWRATAPIRATIDAARAMLRARS